MEYIENLSRNNDFFVGNNQREIERERERERENREIPFKIRKRLFSRRRKIGITRPIFRVPLKEICMITYEPLEL